MFQPNSSPSLSAGIFTAAAVCLLLSACANAPDKRNLATEESSTLAGGRPRIIHRSAADERALSYLWQQQGQFVRIEAADQEVSFAVTSRSPGFGRFMSRRVTTGRLFRDTKGLNLIIGLLHTPLEDKMLATGHRIAFTPGSRQHRIQEGWSLWSDNLVIHPVAGRSDWVLIDAKAWSGSAHASSDADTPQQPTPSPFNHTDQYRSLEERLEVLKKLLDKGLISEEAYQHKSQQILNEL